MDANYKSQAERANRALGRAVAAEDWPTVVDIVDASWPLLQVA